jgi:hypothetical protein
MPFDVNPGRPDSEGGEFMSGALIAPALWTEFELSNGSPVTLHTAFEMARSYQTRWRHPGSARENEFLYGWLSLTPGVGLQVGF